MPLCYFCSRSQVQELFQVCLHVLHYNKYALATFIAINFPRVEQIDQFCCQSISRYCWKSLEYLDFS